VIRISGLRKQLADEGVYHEVVLHETIGLRSCVWL